MVGWIDGWTVTYGYMDTYTDMITTKACLNDSDLVTQQHIIAISSIHIAASSTGGGMCSGCSTVGFMLVTDCMHICSFFLWQRLCRHMIGSIDGDHSIQLGAVNGHQFAQKTHYAVDLTHL